MSSTASAASEAIEIEAVISHEREVDTEANRRQGRKMKTKTIRMMMNTFATNRGGVQGRIKPKSKYISIFFSILN